MKLLSRILIAARVIILHCRGYFFDREWYLKAYPDVEAAGKNPLLHFARYGIFEDRKPNGQFDSAFYLNNNPDVARVSISPVLHFMLHGFREHRQWRHVPLVKEPGGEFIERQEFFNLIDRTRPILEFGKLSNPLISESKKINVITHGELEDLYRNELFADPDKIAEVDYVIRNNNWSVIHEKFDFLVTSHKIEQVPCLIRFFADAGHVLNDGGMIYAAIPDYRYGFDSGMIPSTILDVIEAKHEKREKPGIREVLETLLLRNPVKDPVFHWKKGEYRLTTEKYSEIDPHRLKKALSKDLAICTDVHCWKFTPETFRYIAETLYEIGEIDFQLKKIYHTMPNTSEFFVIMEKNRRPAF